MEIEAEANNNYIIYYWLILFTQDDYEGIWNVVAFLLAFVCCVCQVQ